MTDRERVNNFTFHCSRSPSLFTLSTSLGERENKINKEKGTMKEKKKKSAERSLSTCEAHHTLFFLRVSAAGLGDLCEYMTELLLLSQSEHFDSEQS